MKRMGVGYGYRDHSSDWASYHGRHACAHEVGMLHAVCYLCPDAVRSGARSFPHFRRIPILGRRIHQQNQAHLYTGPPHGLVASCTLISILMLPPPVVNTWVRGGPINGHY